MNNTEKELHNNKCTTQTKDIKLMDGVELGINTHDGKVQKSKYAPKNPYLGFS